VAITTKISGKDIHTGADLDQEMYSKNGITHKHIVGAVVYNAPLFDYDPSIKPFFNPEFGTDMNQDVTFGGTPELIFNGGSGGTEWTGSGPGQWDFSDSGKVTVSHGPNNSQALFQDAGTIDTSNYSALTGKVDLDNYTPSTQDILFQFKNGGSVLGDPVSMNAFIDTGNFGEQSFAIPLSSFNLAGATVNQFTMTVQRSAGHNPHISFDDFQLEETGEQLKFTINVLGSEVFCVEQINLVFVDNITGITSVSGSSENATVPNLSYDKILGVDGLSNGIVFTRRQNERDIINLNLKNLADFLGFAVITDHISDGVNTLVTLSVMLDTPIILDGKTNDELSWTINDDLSGLIRCTSLARGTLRSDPTAI